MGGYCKVFPDNVEGILVVTEFEELIRRIEMTLEDASRNRKRVYSPRNRLRRGMVAGHPIFELFVSGSSTGSDKAFHCMICQRDVSLESRGAAEFSRHFFGSHFLWVGTSISMWPIEFGTTCLFSIG